MQITKHYTVTGKVQDVGYRDYIKKAADAMELMGVVNHAENSDGVIIVAQDDETLFPEFERAMRFGSVLSFVKSINAQQLDKSAYYRSFQVEGIVLSTQLTQELDKIKTEAHMHGS